MYRKHYTNMAETRDSVNNMFFHIKESNGFHKKIDLNVNALKMPDTTSLGEQIAYFRKLKGWTQIELAEKLGTCKECIRSYEHKCIKLINVKLLKKMIEVLDIEDKIILPPYEKFILYNQSKNMKKILKDYNLNVYRLAKEIKTDDSNVMKWVKGKSIMSRTSFEKLMNYIEKRNNDKR